MRANGYVVSMTILGMLCLLCLSSVTAQTGAPEITLPETEHSFGHVTQGDNLTHTFIIKNTGDAPLKLIKAKGS